jgi:oligosaccharide amylase
MAVYQPTAIIGNSTVLVSLGARGEIMALFYPHIDFPQNIHEGMPAVYFGKPGSGTLSWTFEPEWEGTQEYPDDSNVLETRLFHARRSLRMTICDLVHPTANVMARRFEVVNAGSERLQATLYQYLDLQLGETEAKNAIHYHPDRSNAVQYWRNISIAVAGDRFDEFQCGRTRGPTSAKKQMAAGALGGQVEDIGDVDFAGGWRLTLGPGESATRLLLLAASSNEAAAMADTDLAREVGYERLLDVTQQHWRKWLAHSRRLKIEPHLEKTYHRSLLAIPLLFDDDYGAILAAPEFDPDFERSGGYGYCWPRDAAEVVLALHGAGFPQLAARFFEWARRVQTEQGYWEQRYWLSGEKGPAWCTTEDRLQIDQTAAVVFAMHRHWRSLGPAARLEFLEASWDSIRAAGEYLADSIGPDGLHATASDLWETFTGHFAYSNAAVHAALVAGADLAWHFGEQQTAQAWTELAARVRQATLERFWTGTHFARRIDDQGKRDDSVDSSMLGLLDPFELLSLDNDAERAMVESCVETIVARLAVKYPDGIAIRRFEEDAYVSGAAGGVNTLWLSRVLLRLALHYAPSDPAKAAAYRDRALGHLEVVRRRATQPGLLPELIGEAPSGSGWAVPHAWAMASFVVNVLLLDELNHALGHSRRAT